MDSYALTPDSKEIIISTNLSIKKWNIESGL